ncbi:MFS transporter [Pseudonocardia spirodelae]|uniref:MFS transporter n=1 Tax=Pseudonocardia spirodelae TaxID=3133431 RepID=A0ABU8T166_9PSEU
MTPVLTFLFALAGGAAVGNLYWAQPLLDVIAADLGASPAAAGWLVTLTQIGYAAGILLVVPLGDVLDRRRLVPAMMGLSALALLACAAAPGFAVLLTALCALGLCTVAGQLLTPLAGDLADPARRGRVVGTVASGLLTGILVSRAVSGLVAGAAGWRTVYVAAAVLDAVLAVVLLWRVPADRARDRVPYVRLIGSVFALVRTERTVRWTLVLGACGFGAFTLFWTALTFLLSAPPFGYPVTVIGLFGLAGLAGALAAQRSGRLHDRGLSLPATGVAWVLALAAFAVAAAGARSVLLILLAIVLLDVAVQGQNLLNQSRLFTVSAGARSRLNTAFVVGNFVGGAAGSAAAGLLWTAGGWPAVCTAGAVVSVVALGVWALGRRGPLVAGPVAQGSGT